MINYKKAELKNIEIYEKFGIYRLKAVYEYENENGRYELTIPNIMLPITKNAIPNISDIFHEHYFNGHYFNEHYIENASGKLRIDKANMVENDSDFEGVYFIKTLESFPKKMTVEEIEKRLGYKIEIVSRKE